MKRVERSFIRKRVAFLAAVTLALVLDSRGLFAQGIVNFANTGTFATTRDRSVYDPTTCAKMVGTNYVAALYFGTEYPSITITNLAVRSLDDLSLASAIVRFRDVDPTSPRAGTWVGGLRTLPGVTVGQGLTMQVRVWDISKFATFGDSLNMGGISMQSVPFAYTVPDPDDIEGRKIQNFPGITVLSSCTFAPTVLVQPKGTNVVADFNEDATFSILAGAITQPLRYQWRCQGTNISDVTTNLPNATNASYTITNVKTNHVGHYSVVVTNTSGSVTSAVATLFVHGDSAARLKSMEYAVDQFRMHIYGLTNRAYVVQSSTNLVNWQTVFTNYVSFWYTNLSASNDPMRFYRAVTNN